jgi:hypothetical protein
VTAYQVQRYLMKRIPKLPSPPALGSGRRKSENYGTTSSRTSFFTAGLANGPRRPLVSSKQASLKPVRVFYLEFEIHRAILGGAQLPEQRPSAPACYLTIEDIHARSDWAD